ncbi:hypothetical protein PANDA_021628, partial [Ailuropoda melanoleuca]
MEQRNQTPVSEFILLGLSKEGEVQPLLLWLFLSMYLVTFTGNLLIVLAIVMDSRLHTPMYFFLANLSFSDICFTSKFCCILLLVCWVLSVLDSLLQDLMVLQLSFCTQIEIPHFFCELNQVIQLTCSDTFFNNLAIYLASGLLGVLPLIGILFSYSRIVTSILKISSSGGKCKAFSTCGSHLSVVSLFYGTSFGVYLSSAASQNSRATAIASVMYMVVTPMLNPFIYGLRNRDIKLAL